MMENVDNSLARCENAGFCLLVLCGSSTGPSSSGRDFVLRSIDDYLAARNLDLVWPNPRCPYLGRMEGSVPGAAYYLVVHLGFPLFESTN